MLLNSLKHLFVLTLAIGTLGFEELMNTKAIHAAMTGEALHVGDFFFLFGIPFQFIQQKYPLLPSDTLNCYSKDEK